MGIAYFLNAKDLHFGNIIASGNSPVLIDHETITSPKLKESNESKISTSVLGSLLLPIKDSSLPLYVYGLGSSIFTEYNIDKLNEKFSNNKIKEIKSELGLKKFYMANKPFNDGITHNLANYQKDFKKGFKKLYNLIIKQKDYLLSKNSPIIQFENCKIRFINRPTKVYNTILDFLNKPTFLSSPIKYGLKLEILARAYTEINFDQWASIVEYERTQMLLGDIPVFYIRVQDKYLEMKNSKIDLIEKSAIEIVYEKIKNVSHEDYKYQLKLISDSVKL